MSLLQKYKRLEGSVAMLSESRDRLLPLVDLAGEPHWAGAQARLAANGYSLRDDDEVRAFYVDWMIENVHGGVDPRSDSSQ